MQNLGNLRFIVQPEIASICMKLEVTLVFKVNRINNLLVAYDSTRAGDTAIYGLYRCVPL